MTIAMVCSRKCVYPMRRRMFLCLKCAKSSASNKNRRVCSSIIWVRRRPFMIHASLVSWKTQWTEWNRPRWVNRCWIQESSERVVSQQPFDLATRHDTPYRILHWLEISFRSTPSSQSQDLEVTTIFQEEVEDAHPLDHIEVCRRVDLHREVHRMCSTCVRCWARNIRRCR